MKHAVLLIVSFAFGFLSSLTTQLVRFDVGRQVNYRKGYALGRREVQKEAVREGHAHWTRRELDGVTEGIEWNPSLPNYRGAAMGDSDEWSSRTTPSS